MVTLVTTSYPWSLDEVVNATLFTRWTMCGMWLCKQFLILNVIQTIRDTKCYYVNIPVYRCATNSVVKRGKNRYMVVTLRICFILHVNAKFLNFTTFRKSEKVFDFCWSLSCYFFAFFSTNTQKELSDGIRVYHLLLSFPVNV